MRRSRLLMALFLATVLSVLTACAKKSEQPASNTVTIDQVRKQAATAFDGTISSTQRRSAADEAMRLLMTMLTQPDSTAISDQEWAKSPRPGVERMVRHIPLDGNVHLYALSLPGSSLVDHRERVVVQMRKTGSAPQASELALLPDSTLQTARALKEGSRQMVTLAMDLAGGGGYVAHFETTGDQFQPVNSAFAGLAGKYGTLTLQTRESYLVVSGADRSVWNPTFDSKHPLRLMLGPDLTLDWKQRFTLVDDSKFDAFELLAIAQNPGRCNTAGACPEALSEQAKKTPQDAVKAAWEQATAKLTLLLQNEKTFPDEFTGRLPEGSRSLRQQGRELSVRLITVPAPDGITPRAYTAVQFRAGAGIPMARTVALPGVVESYRVMEHAGSPALFLIVDQTRDAKSTVRTKGLHLLRLNASNDWVPAVNWLGSIPNAPNWNLVRANEDSLSVEWETTKSPKLTVAQDEGAAPSVSICRLPNECHKLTWVGGKLHALGLLFAHLTEATQALPADRLLSQAGQLAQFLSQIDPAQVPTAQLLRTLDPGQALQMRVLSAGNGTELVTMPANPTGTRTAVLHAKDQAQVIQAHDGVVTEWVGAQVVQGGSGQRLLILGRSDKAAVLMVFSLVGDKWVAMDALPDKVDRILQESVRVVNNPGQTRPVQGLMVFGGSSLTAKLTSQGAEFCENRVACVTYGYNSGWKLETR